MLLKYWSIEDRSRFISCKYVYRLDRTKSYFMSDMLHNVFTDIRVCYHISLKKLFFYVYLDFVYVNIYY
jgi:hypothetical protein